MGQTEPQNISTSEKQLETNLVYSILDGGEAEVQSRADKPGATLAVASCPKYKKCTQNETKKK
jgi:hypothetical protein